MIAPDSQELERFCEQVVYSNISPVRGDKQLSITTEYQRLATGFPQLDGILRGGLLRGGITELAGPTNTGKTVVSSFPRRC